MDIASLAIAVATDIVLAATLVVALYRSRAISLRYVTLLRHVVMSHAILLFFEACTPS